MSGRPVSCEGHAPQRPPDGVCSLHGFKALCADCTEYFSLYAQCAIGVSSAWHHLPSPPPKKAAKKHSPAPSKKAEGSSSRGTGPVRQPSPEQHERASVAGAPSPLKGLLTREWKGPTTLPAPLSSQSWEQRAHRSPRAPVTSPGLQDQAQVP